MFKFKINNREWEIEEISQEEIKIMQNKRNANEEENIKSIDTRYYGITYCDEQKIYLDKDLTEDRKRATLIHELTHCYIWNYGLYNVPHFNEEMVCDLVSSINDFINDIVGKFKKILDEEK